MQEKTESLESCFLLYLTIDEGVLCENSDKRRKYAGKATKGFRLA